MKRLVASSMLGLCFAFSATASAQEHGNGAPSPHGEGFGGATPAASGSASAHSEHGAAGHAAHVSHDPPAFNFADIERYRAEKEKAARGEGAHPPVTPYAYLLVNALLLFAIYYKMGKKPISEGLASRRSTIAKELEEAAKIKEEATQRIAEYDDKLAKLDEELQRIKDEFIKTGESDRDRMIRDAEEKAERMRKDAEFLIAQEVKQVRDELLRYAVEAAVTAAESVLQSKLNGQDQDRLNEQFLKQLATLPVPSGSLRGGDA